MPLPQENERYTYADYCTWDDQERWELIEGVPYAMSPSPNQQHQEISGELYRQIANFLKGKPCKAFHAPFDVRLNADEGDDSVCQPDLLVVCDASKLDGKCCNGAPDLVVEILSKSTASRDTIVKLNAYQQAGVPEYWIVDPDSQLVHVYILQDGLYYSQGFSAKNTVPVKVLEGCRIDLQEVFGG